MINLLYRNFKATPTIPPPLPERAQARGRIKEGGSSRRANLKKRRFCKRWYSLILAVIISLSPNLYPLTSISYSLSPALALALALERTLILDISVTNPSDKETQALEIRADLPEELKKEDIISSDGLEVDFDGEKGSLFVVGKVLLRPAETTIYKIEVRDVWLIPGSEGIPVDDISAHIAAFRERQRELGALREAQERALLLRSGQARPDARRSAQNIILLGILALLLGAMAYIGVQKKEFLLPIRNKLRKLSPINRRRFVRVPNHVVTEYRFLPEGRITPSIPVKDISQGGLALSLDKAYASNSVIELKIKSPPYVQNLVFRGFVVWQKKITARDRKEHYLTGISFGETDEKDYQKLKKFINEKRSSLSRRLKREQGIEIRG